MVPTIFAFVCYFVITCMGKHSDSKTRSLGGGQPHTGDERIKIFRDKGKAFLSVRDYIRASEYYTAALQLIEGIEGVDGQGHNQLRRTCTLTLAECEIKNERFEEAIARCTEVILESPSIRDGTDNDNVTQKAIAKAYYRRGVSLNLLGRPELALLDLEAAERESPESDSLITAQIASVRTYLNRVNTTVENTEVDSDLVDELQDVLDDAQLNHPKSYITQMRIQAMLEGQGSINKELLNNPFEGSPSLQEILNGAGLRAQRDQGSGGSAVPLLPDMSSLGGLNGALGALSGMSGGLTGLISLAGQLCGIDPKIIAEVKDVAGVLLSVFDNFKKFYCWVVSQNEQIMLVFIGAWMLKCAGYSNNT